MHARRAWVRERLAFPQPQEQAHSVGARRHRRVLVGHVAGKLLDHQLGVVGVDLAILRGREVEGKGSGVGAAAVAVRANASAVDADAPEEQRQQRRGGKAGSRRGARPVHVERSHHVILDLLPVHVDVARVLHARERHEEAADLAARCARRDARLRRRVVRRRAATRPLFAPTGRP